MSDENMPSIPDAVLRTLLHQRLINKMANPTATQPGRPPKKIDPYALMVNRKKQNEGEVAADEPVQKWPEADIKKLEDFCQQHGIVGFNCGRMSPLAALALLKQKLGIVDEPTTSEGYGPNYPYTEAMKKKQILHG